MTHWLHLLLRLLLLAAFPSACTPYARVSERRPLWLDSAAGDDGRPGSPAVLISQGVREQEKQPLRSLGFFLAAADQAAAELRRDPRDARALNSYNMAMTQCFAAMHKAKVKVGDGPVEIPGPNGTYVLTARTKARPAERDPSLYDYVASANLEISGSYMKDRMVKSGLGAPLVAVRREARPDAKERFALPRAYYGVTAIARFHGFRCELEFADPLVSETALLGDYAYPLAADFTAPFALMLSQASLQRLEILNLFRPGESAESARIVRLQPFDPDKTTVLVVHGLGSSPATWAPMLAALRADPSIRKRYQFWFYEYPSGYPYPYSAAILRRELDAAFKSFPQKKPVILIGHSMGGIISRLMITDSGDQLWRKTLWKSPDQLPLPPAERKILADSYVFSARPEVGRVIFIAAPHRGSQTASIWPVRLIAKLIRSPQTLLKVTLDTMRFAVTPPDGREIKRAPNSLDTLSPSNPFVKALREIPLRRGVPFHSIMGDRGKGNTPDSSDGLVPYWSSHLDGAVSEKIVPSGHSAHQHPEAVAEVLRILKSTP